MIKLTSDTVAPCPHCGDNTSQFVGEWEEGKMIVCAMCDAHGPTAYYCDGEDDVEERAVELWNWRGDTSGWISEKQKREFVEFALNGIKEGVYGKKTISS